MKLFLQPHSDDAVLFGAYTLLREKPHAITILTSVVQEQRYGITAFDREREDVKAFEKLGLDPYGYLAGGVGLEQWHCRDDRTNWESVCAGLVGTDAALAPDLVYAPLPEEGGHEHHNRVGEIAAEVFGERVIFYATYRRGERRTRTETEVSFEPHWPALKLRAMACYESQITLENTRPWFDDWQREWVSRP